MAAGRSGGPSKVYRRNDRQTTKTKKVITTGHFREEQSPPGRFFENNTTPPPVTRPPRIVIIIATTRPSRSYTESVVKPPRANPVVKPDGRRLKRRYQLGRTLGTKNTTNGSNVNFFQLESDIYSNRFRIFEL